MITCPDCKEVQRHLSRLRRLLPAIVLCASAIAPGLAQADYPERPIKLIVAYAPGGGTDITARLTAEYLQRYLGNNASFVVLNRPGAGGAIGFTELANAAPDGYTIGFVNTPNVLTIPIEPCSTAWRSGILRGADARSTMCRRLARRSTYAETPT